MHYTVGYNETGTEAGGQKRDRETVRERPWPPLGPGETSDRRSATCWPLVAGSQTARGGRYWSKRVAVLLLYGSCPLASSENLPQDPPQPLQRHIAILERQRIETQIEASMHADVTPSVALLTRAPGRCGMRVW